MTNLAIEEQKQKVKVDLLDLASLIEEDKELSLSNISEELVELLEKNCMELAKDRTGYEGEKAITNTERVSEIQRSRIYADLLELIGGIEEDNNLTKPKIKKQLYEIIRGNFLFEPLDIVSRVKNEEV